VQTLWKDFHVAVEVYKSSLITERSTFGIVNSELENKTALVRFHPEWCPGIAQSLVTGMAQAVTGGSTTWADYDCPHMAVIPMYFLSLTRPPPPVMMSAGLSYDASLASPGAALQNCSTPSASCTDCAIREWMEQQNAVPSSQVWEQKGGRNTFTLSDDNFQLLPTPGPEDIVVRKDAVEYCAASDIKERKWYNSYEDQLAVYTDHLGLRPGTGKVPLTWPLWLPGALVVGLAGLCCLCFLCCIVGVLIYVCCGCSGSDSDSQYTSHDGSDDEKSGSEDTSMRYEDMSMDTKNDKRVVVPIEARTDSEDSVANLIV
jgi:hypothetical protein